MAPAAAAEQTSNWLSFSLSPMEMLASSNPNPQIPLSSSSQQYYLDPFYSNDWANGRMYGDYVVPKLEDFLGPAYHNPPPPSYNNTQADSNQDSSSQLTHLYDSNHQNDLKAMAAAFSTNSGSEVDDSASVTRTNHQLGGCGGDFMTQSIQSAHTELPAPTTAGNLSLTVVSEQTGGIVSVGGESNSVKKISDTFGQRTSIYRGVTRHRWTGRYEAHLWDNSCRREGQARKGRQVYLGGYDKEEKAARSYDLAALKYWGPTATTNFPISTYTNELEEMKHATKQEFIASLRRKSSGFSRGASIYRGVTRHHQQGRWQARIGRVAGNKDLYLGTFATEEEAAEAYDIAAIKFRGVNAVTNFEMNRYDVDAILKSNLPIGGAAKRLKLATESAVDHQQKQTLLSHHQQTGGSSTINFGSIQAPAAAPTPVSCPMPFDAIFHENLIHQLGSSNGAAQVMGSYPSDPYGSATFTQMGLMPQNQGEFYIWPHHQSYN